MKFYPEDYIVEVDVQFTDLNGAAITPTEIRAVLYDGEDQVIVDFGALPFTVSDGHKLIPIAAAFNVLEDGELSAARILRVELKTAAGSVRRAHSYIIEGEVRLALMVNSFMTLEAAEILVRDLPHTTGWNGATTDQRYAALVEAFNRLTRISMKFPNPLPAGQVRHPDDETVILRSDWSEIDEATFLAMPAPFRKALRMAQIVEANELLEGDTIASKHRAGIISETVGESSMMLRTSKLELSVSSSALRHLTGYIYYNLRLARS